MRPLANSPIRAGFVLSRFWHECEDYLGTYRLLDIVPKGRDETINGNLTDWVRHHDRYGEGGFVDPTGRYVAPKETEPCCGSK